jgi:lysophospholipase L1-like esterase
MASVLGLGSEFDDFLFAAIGDDLNGMPLSVVSVLARVDLDPWQEAATLAALPAELATQRLTMLLAALPQRTLQRTSAASTAVRLIALLPPRTNADTRLAAQRSDAASATHPRTLLNPILIAIYLILSLGIQIFAARRDLALRADTVHVSAAPTVPSQTPPATSDK